MLIRLTIIALAAVLSSGCGIYTTYLGSKPSLGVEYVWAHKIELDGLQLSIRPYNDIRDFQMVNSIVLVPVYISGEDDPVFNGQDIFYIKFGYLPSDAGFSFDPEAIRLVIDEETFEPTVLGKWLNPDAKYGDSWDGYCGREMPESYQRMSYKPLDKTETGNWHCYKLQFDLPPPHPSKKFSLVVNGFTKNGQEFAIPTIWFEEHEWQSTDSIP